MQLRKLLLGSVAVLLLVGCFRPEGGVMPYTGEGATYWSTESNPCTITLVNTRTEEPIFTMEIPVGKQLVLDFKAGEGDDPVNTPDLMRYEVFELNTQFGTLRNGLTVPDQFSRRIDVSYRPAPEYAPGPPDAEFRVDRPADRPSWWTPQGGPMPQNPAMTIYDD